jgi:hypothetical protein
MKIWANDRKNRPDLSENGLNSGNSLQSSIKIWAKFKLPPWKASAPYGYDVPV